MIYLRTNSEGEILLVSPNPFFDTVAYPGSVPEDFLSTVGLGKYRLVASLGNPVSLEETPGWVAPIPLIGIPHVEDFLLETIVSPTRTLVCNLPILTGSSSFVINVTIRDEGQPDRTVQLECIETSMLPDGNGGQVPEFAYLVNALQNGANILTLTSQVLVLRNSEGVFD